MTKLDLVVIPYSDLELKNKKIKEKTKCAVTCIKNRSFDVGDIKTTRKLLKNIIKAEEYKVIGNNYAILAASGGSEYTRRHTIVRDVLFFFSDVDDEPEILNLTKLLKGLISHYEEKGIKFQKIYIIHSGKVNPQDFKEEFESKPYIEYVNVNVNSILRFSKDDNDELMAAAAAILSDQADSDKPTVVNKEISKSELMTAAATILADQVDSGKHTDDSNKEISKSVLMTAAAAILADQVDSGKPTDDSNKDKASKSELMAAAAAILADQADTGKLDSSDENASNSELMAAAAAILADQADTGKLDSSDENASNSELMAAAAAILSSNTKDEKETSNDNDEMMVAAAAILSSNTKEEKETSNDNDELMVAAAAILADQADTGKTIVVNKEISNSELMAAAAAILSLPTENIGMTDAEWEKILKNDNGPDYIEPVFIDGYFVTLRDSGNSWYERGIIDVADFDRSQNIGGLNMFETLTTNKNRSFVSNQMLSPVDTNDLLSHEKKHDYAIAKFDNLKADNNELPFKKYDIIKVKENSAEWWKGELNGKNGLIPFNWVKPFAICKSIKNYYDTGVYLCPSQTENVTQDLLEGVNIYSKKYDTENKEYVRRAISRLESKKNEILGKLSFKDNQSIKDISKWFHGVPRLFKICEIQHQETEFKRYQLIKKLVRTGKDLFEGLILKKGKWEHGRFHRNTIAQIRKSTQQQNAVDNDEHIITMLSPYLGGGGILYTDDGFNAKTMEPIKQIILRNGTNEMTRHENDFITAKSVVNNLKAPVAKAPVATSTSVNRDELMAAAATILATPVNAKNNSSRDELMAAAAAILATLTPTPTPPPSLQKAAEKDSIDQLLKNIDINKKTLRALNLKYSQEDRTKPQTVEINNLISVIKAAELELITEIEKQELDMVAIQDNMIHFIGELKNKYPLPEPIKIPESKKQVISRGFNVSESIKKDMGRKFLISVKDNQQLVIYYKYTTIIGTTYYLVSINKIHSALTTTISNAGFIPADRVNFDDASAASVFKSKIPDIYLKDLDKWITKPEFAIVTKNIEPNDEDGVQLTLNQNDLIELKDNPDNNDDNNDDKWQLAVNVTTEDEGWIPSNVYIKQKDYFEESLEVDENEKRTIYTWGYNPGVTYESKFGTAIGRTDRTGIEQILGNQKSYQIGLVKPPDDFNKLNELIQNNFIEVTYGDPLKIFGKVKTPYDITLLIAKKLGALVDNNIGFVLGINVAITEGIDNVDELSKAVANLAQADANKKVLQKYAVAHQDYEDEDGDILSFNRGDIIKITEEGEPKKWWKGEIKGVEGWFPSNYTKVATGAYALTLAQAEADRNNKVLQKYAVAQHDHEDKDENYLSFSNGEFIKITEEGEPNKWWSYEWWEGEINGKTGSFPPNLMKQASHIEDGDVDPIIYTVEQTVEEAEAEANAQAEADRSRQDNVSTPNSENELMPGWRAVKTENGEYYWNEDTDETKWELPVKISKPVAETEAEAKAKAEAEAKAKAEAEAKQNRVEDEVKRVWGNTFNDVRIENVVGGWMAVQSPEGSYYYNKNTKEKTFDLPGWVAMKVEDEIRYFNPVTKTTRTSIPTTTSIKLGAVDEWVYAINGVWRNRRTGKNFNINERDKFHLLSSGWAAVWKNNDYYYYNRETDVVRSPWPHRIPLPRNTII